jgi:hypothetical protein
MLLQFCYFYNPVNETPVVTQSDGATDANPNSSAGPTSSTTPPSDRADLRPENIQDAVIRLAGNSQDGIQTAGAFLARLAGRSEHDVMTYMTIPATISGGPSTFCVMAASCFTIPITLSPTSTTNVSFMLESPSQV